MYDLLFSHAGTLTEQDLNEMAKTLDLNVERFHLDMASAAISSKIEKDIDEGKKLHITGTPTFFLNGREVVGMQSCANLKEMIESELEKMRFHPKEPENK